LQRIRVSIQTLRVLETLVLPKPAYNLLCRLTGETRLEVAFSVALKDLVRLRLEAAQGVIKGYEQKYGMPFDEFHKAWQAGQISNPHFYQVE
jgi:hypothetical protein